MRSTRPLLGSLLSSSTWYSPSIPLLAPSTCPRCRLASTIQNLASKRSKSTSSINSEQNYAHLPSRSIIRLKGPDAANFLHNIIPAKILNVPPNPVYTAFLSAGGRILNDVFIYPPSPRNFKDGGEDEWFIEVDSNSAGDLMKHLKKHKLRAKFKLEKLDPEERGLFYCWPNTETGTGMDAIETATTTGGQDPRPGMGSRWIVQPSNITKHLEDVGRTSTTTDAYTVHRILNGIAEGPIEIRPGHALPQESNIDFFGGIDFHKGCYLGQELTIRTHHTGVVRKRILPVQIYNFKPPPPVPVNEDGMEDIYDPDMQILTPPPQSNISRIGTSDKLRSTGKWLDGIGNIGLALCRLEMMTDIKLMADTTSYDPQEEYRILWTERGEASGEEKVGEVVEPKAQCQVKVKPFVPLWLREGVINSLNRKEKKPKKKAREEEDEDEYEVE